MSGDIFSARFRAHLAALPGVGRNGRLLVAWSGGRDSTVLLHLLREHAKPLGYSLSVAHLDHAMRPESAADAAWVSGRCGNWGLPLLSERVEAPPRNETEARNVRRAFLLRARAETGATHIATGHHADDQAETVLFRVLRGTGLRGLAGIAPHTPDGLVRPLLPFWRAEIDAYARDAGLTWREDLTNRDLRSRRNRIRHDLLPRIEREIAPGARGSLVRLAELARAERAGGEEELLADPALSVEGDDAFLITRVRFQAYTTARRARLLRALLRRFGVTTDRSGTRAALAFIRNAQSGRECHLPRGVRLRSEFGRVRLERTRQSEPDIPFRVRYPPARGGGAGIARIGGRRWEVRYRPTSAGDHPVRSGEELISMKLLSHPLVVRGWRPGDRLRTKRGTRKLKKLFLEARLPTRLRGAVPVVADESGTVFWVVGVVRASDIRPPPGHDGLHLNIAEC